MAFATAELRKRLAHIPGLSKTLPYPIGNLFDVYRAMNKADDSFSKYQLDGAKECGSLYKLFVGPTAMLVCTSPHMIKEVVRQDPDKYSKGLAYDPMKVWIGDSIVMTEGDAWRQKRKLMNKAFSASSLKKLIPSFVVCADRTAANWDAAADTDRVVDIPDDITNTTLDVIGMTGFGYDMKASVRSGEELPIKTEICNVLRTLANRDNKHMFARFLPIQTYLKYYNDGRDLAKSLEALDGIMSDIVRNRLAEKDVSQRNDLLSILIDISRNDAEVQVDDSLASHQELKDEVNLFMFAGHETTSTMLSWALFYLFTKNDVRDRVLAEIEEHVGLNINSQNLDYENLNSLTYTTQVLKETLRLHSPAAGFLREPKEDVVIGNMEIPKNVPILFSSYAIHHDQSLYPDPYKFDPERFSAAESKKRHPFSFVPFAAGPRNCIGMQFAMLEARAILARLLPRFQLKIESSPTTESALLLRPKDLLATVHRR